MAWLARLFRTRWPRSTFIPSPIYEDEVKRDMLASLLSNPGFELFIIELNNRKATIEDQLARPQPQPKGLDGLIANAVQRARDEEAVFWLGWMQHYAKRALAIKSATAEQVPAPLGR